MGSKSKMPAKSQAEIDFERRQIKELSEQRGRTNRNIKAGMRGAIGPRSLLSGGYSGVS